MSWDTTFSIVNLEAGSTPKKKAGGADTVSRPCANKTSKKQKLKKLQADDKIWDIVRVIPTAEEQITCRIKQCSKDAAVSWASNLNPDRRQLVSL